MFDGTTSLRHLYDINVKYAPYIAKTIIISTKNTIRHLRKREASFHVFLHHSYRRRSFISSLSICPAIQNDSWEINPNPIKITNIPGPGAGSRTMPATIMIKPVPINSSLLKMLFRDDCRRLY